MYENMISSLAYLYLFHLRFGQRYSLLTYVSVGFAPRALSKTYIGLSIIS